MTVGSSFESDARPVLAWLDRLAHTTGLSLCEQACRELLQQHLNGDNT